MSKFDPTKIKFTKSVDDDDEVVYILPIDNKIYAKLYYYHCLNEWELSKIIHCIDNTTKEVKVYCGAIRSDEFAMELVINGLMNEPNVYKFYNP